MAEPILELESVVMDYGQTRVLHDLDLRIGPGEFTAITGPSGSGKSTLLNLMGLLERPTSGRLRVRGQDTAGLSDRALARLRGRTIGFVFQFHHLLQAFSARENVYMPVLVDRGRVDREMGQRADALLARVGLGERGPSPVRTLSGGQQQRVAIARALALEPPLVLADEPTGNLDTETADKVFDLLREVSADAGTAFVVVTHDPRLADRCDRIVRLVDGRIVSDATGEAQGPCRACGYGPCLRDQCLRAEDIPGRVCP